MNKEGERKMDSQAINFESIDNMFDNMFNTVTETPTTEENSVQNVVPQKQEQVVNNTSQMNLQESVEKLHNIIKEMNNEFVEREELINIMVLSLITNSNLLMLGDPGTGKSLISTELCSRIDNSNFFQWLLNKTSDPAELLGTFSIKGMENDEFKRITDGKLPEANIAFIDEVYKCNSATLNALLSIMNEHIFYNDGKVVPVPLISMFAASNEPPEDESLLAMHDRFMFRIKVDYIHDASSKKKMYNNYIYKRAGMAINTSHTTISKEELNILQEETKRVVVSKDIINEFIKLINMLNKNENIKISDRRANECFKILQGSALLNGRNKVGPDDFKALKYVLWDTNCDITGINTVIEQFVNPFDKDYEKYTRQFEEIVNEINKATDQKDKNTRYFTHQNSLRNLSGKLNKLINEASGLGKDVTDYVGLRDKIKKYNENMSNEALGATLSSMTSLSNDDSDSNSSGGEEIVF